MTDTVGHGTFVTGLIAALDGNGIGGKGVAGNTQVFAIRGSKDGDFTTRELLRGIDFAIRRGADVLNMSLAGGASTDTPTLARALALAFLNDVLPVAASGNTGNSRQPAPVPGRGARRQPRRARDRPVGGRHQARRPAGRLLDPQPLREHRRAGRGDDCTSGVLSTLPAYTGTEWDIVPPGTCPSELVPSGRLRASRTARAPASPRRSCRASPRSSGRSSRGWPPSRWPRC